MKKHKKAAAKYWAMYFGSTVDDALNCNDMTINCMVGFAHQQAQQAREEAFRAVYDRLKFIVDCDILMKPGKIYIGGAILTLQDTIPDFKQATKGG